jgi:hypothetical protein
MVADLGVTLRQPQNLEGAFAASQQKSYQPTPSRATFEPQHAEFREKSGFFKKTSQSSKKGLAAPGGYP